MPHLIHSACMTDYIEVAHSVGLEPYRKTEAIGLPQTCLREAAGPQNFYAIIYPASRSFGESR